jgi:hypothetical protein
MALRIIVGLTALVAIIQGLAGDPIAGGILTLALVVLGLVYGAMAIDAEDATAYLAVTIAVGAAASMDAGSELEGVLNHIPAIGMHLDAIVDQVSIALYAGVITILIRRTINRLKG